MYQCPHCGKAGVSGLGKWWSSAAAPAKCVRCGGFSHVRASGRNGIFVVGGLLLLLAAVVAAAAQSWLLAILGLVVVLGCYTWLWHSTELVPTSQEQSASARWFNWALLAAAIVFVASTVFIARAAPNPSIERTSSSKLRLLPAAAHVKRCA